ncbi:Uncharacterized protein Fot_05901 [Forsythia ovata]|uniref:Uncharacterized protein n=1 Tax=Forsythia ovata TaxID=205694 RepID=A0ABD1WRF1_9LAMI
MNSPPHLAELQICFSTRNSKIFNDFYVDKGKEFINRFQTSATYADVHPGRQPCYLGGIYRFILEHPCCNGSPTGHSKGKLYHGLDGVIKNDSYSLEIGLCCCLYPN